MCTMTYTLRVTPFILAFAGAVFYYCSLVTSILWVCHILGVTWRVKFPVHARSFEQKSYFKYVYVAMIAIALTLPFGSIAASFATGGYGLPRFPPTTCLAIDPGASFYGFVIPVVAILGLGICAILALFCLLISTIQLRTGKMDLAKTGVKVSFPYHATYINFSLLVIVENSCDDVVLHVLCL